MQVIHLGALLLGWYASTVSSKLARPILHHVNYMCIHIQVYPCIANILLYRASRLNAVYSYVHIFDNPYFNIIFHSVCGNVYSFRSHTLSLFDCAVCILSLMCLYWHNNFGGAANFSHVWIIYGRKKKFSAPNFLHGNS